MDETPDDRLAPIARRQHGAFNRSQAHAAGFTRRMIERRVAHRRWFRLDTGVYALASHPFVWERQAMAATLAVEGAMLSGRSAAALHDLQGFTRGALEVTVPRHCKARTALANVRRSDFSQRTQRLGIPVMTVAHTIVSLAGSVTPARLEAAVDDALVRRLVGLDELQDRFASWAPRRRKGVGRLREILQRRGDGAEPPRNQLERRLRAVLDHPSLPTFSYEHNLPWLPRSSSRVDAFCRIATLVVEADGRAWHTREAEFAMDRRRDNLATMNAHATLRFTWIDLARYPDECREVVRRTVAHRSSLASAAS
jgi:very-short-patch-repair endonuclease